MRKNNTSTLSKTGIFSTLKNYLHKHRLGELLVTSRHITPGQLRRALKAQKGSGHTLGQILLAQGLVTRRQLGMTLTRQYVLRSTATFLLFCASLTSSKENEAQAGMIKDIPAQISLVTPASTAMYGDMNVYPSLWGSSEKASRNLKAFTKWTGMFDRFENEVKTGRSQSLINAWRNDLSSLQNGSIKTMAENVNAMVNKTKYIPDSRNWNKSDYWATPAEFLTRGGDCEDFAIAKYTALRMLGVPEERLRVAIVHDNLKNIPHAVLVVYTEQGPYILDNQIKKMISARSGSRYRPIFSINRTAWWLHTQGSGDTRLASAN